MAEGLFSLKIVTIALRSLAAHPFRTFLSALGVVFGVGSVVVMISIGEGARLEALSQIEDLGTRNIFLRAARPPGREGAQSASGQGGMTLVEAEKVTDAVPGVDYAAPAAALSSPPPVDWGGEGVEALAVTPAFLQVMGLQVREGRFLGILDLEERRLVCILGHEVAQALGERGRVGRLLRWGSETYEVVGILDSRSWRVGPVGALSTRNINRTVLFPLGAVPGGQGSLTELTIQVAHIGQVLPASAVIRRNLSRSKKLAKDWQVVVPLELLRQVGRTQRTFSLVLGSIAAVSLLVGGIGIMNIMLAGVTERRREIGIRRAVGATRRNIVEQFLGEALLLTLGGGLLGLALGTAASYAIGVSVGWPTVITWWSFAISLGMSLLVGIVSGMYPAVQAAALDPVEAIRYE